MGSCGGSPLKGSPGGRTIRRSYGGGALEGVPSKVTRVVSFVGGPLRGYPRGDSMQGVPYRMFSEGRSVERGHWSSAPVGNPMSGFAWRVPLEGVA
jgi:hypothetical protein